MSFATLPMWAVLAGSAAITVVVVGLYLLKQQPRPVIVSNVKFWLKAAAETKPRWLLSKRVPLLALLLSLLAALLVFVDLAEPSFGDDVRGTSVIVVEAGQSMGATEARTTRLSRAKDQAERWAERALAGGEVAVIRAGIRPEVVVPITGDRGEVASGLDRLENVDEGPLDLAGALSLADEIIARRGGRGQVFIIGDRSPVQAAASTVPRLFVSVAMPADTIAIRDFSARRDPRALGEYRARVVVRSYAQRPAKAMLRVRDRDTAIFEREIELTPSEASSFEMRGFSTAEGQLVAQLEDIEITGSADALASDDVAYAVVAPLVRTRVLVASPGNRYLDAALSMHGGIEVERVAPSALAAKSPEELAGYDVIIADRAPLPSGVSAPVLVVDPGEDGLVASTETVRNPPITASLSGHSALNGVRLNDVRISSARSLRTEPGDQVLLRAGRHALAIARERRCGPTDTGGCIPRLVVLGFSLGDTDLVTRPAFPLVVDSMVRWLDQRESVVPLPDRPGEPLAVTATELVTAEGTEAIEGPLAQVTEAGIYRTQEHAQAFSAAQDSGALPSSDATLPAIPLAWLPPLSAWIAAAFLLVLLLEWLLLHRGRLE